MKITVQAGPNEGKTTIALLIADALARAGIDVTVEDPDVGDLGTALADPIRPYRLGVLRSKEGFNVVVHTVPEPNGRDQCELLRQYAQVHGLDFKDKAQLNDEWDEEEWEGVRCAAFGPEFNGPGPLLALVTDDGVIKVVAFFAGDDRRWDTDKFVEVEASELRSAAKHRRRLHAE